MTAPPDSPGCGLATSHQTIPDQLGRLCDSLSDAVVIDDGHRILQANGPAEAMFGYAPRELVGRRRESILAAPVAEADSRLPDGGANPSDLTATRMGALVGLRKDGSTFPIEVIRTRLKVDGQDLFCGVLHDLSDRAASERRSHRDISGDRQVEVDLRASQKFIEAVAKASPPMIYVFDLDEGRLKYLNRSLLAELGYPESAAAIDRLDDFTAFIPVEDRAHLEKVLREWRSLPDGHVRDDEYRLRDAQGALHWFLGRETAFTRNADGAVLQILGTLYDITERKRAESRLRESEALLRGLVETSPIPMVVVTADADSRVLLMNQQFTKTFGYSLQDVPDISAWWVRAYPDTAYRNRVRASWLDAIAEAERMDSTAIAPVTAQVACKDGSIRDLEVHMGRFGNRALVVFSDLTERKHTEELLRQSEERYRLIVENQTEFIVKWRPDGTRTFVNDSYCRTFGVREQDCLGTSLFPLVAPEYREAIHRQTAALTPEAPEYTEEHVALAPDGRRWQQWTNRGIFDAEGRLVEMLSTGRDISERKEAEEKLRQSRVHLLASQHIARVGSWEMDLQSLDDLNDNSLRCSDECFRIFGRTPGEIDVTGRVFFDLVHPDDRDRVCDAAHRAVRERSLYSIDHRTLLSNGDERVMHGQAELMLDPATGRPVKLIGTTQDVTDRVRLEEQLRQSQKMQAIGQLAGGVAHDFNNLLTVINGHVEMVLDHLGAEDPLRGELTPIRDAGHRAALLTRQLLLFSRKAVLEPRVLNCGDLVQRTSQMLRRLISEEIHVATVSSPSLDRVKADPSQIEQVIMNLSLNACDAMPGGGRLTIETRNAVVDADFCREHPEGAPGRYVQLIVSDTGSGMTPHVKAHLFEPFFTTKGPGRGTGLGLATVYGIVQESGGFVTVSSDLNVGTTFSVFLPALDGSDPATTADAIEHSPLRGSETVLVVEDDPGVRTITTLALKKYGYHVLEASDGSAALRLSNDRDTIDLLITDVVMPEMSGRRLADALLRTRPHCRVLFMSGYNEEMLADRAAHSPADAFIQKPFTVMALATKVREILDRRLA
jgi:PAS domain S-box-containing protein